MIAYVISIVLFACAMLCSTIAGMWLGVLRERRGTYRYMSSINIKVASSLFYILSLIGFGLALLYNFVATHVS